MIEHQRYEFVEVDAGDKGEQARLARLGYVKYGVRRDLREGRPTIIKMRREEKNT
jgi:hypothetical protein